MRHTFCLHDGAGDAAATAVVGADAAALAALGLDDGSGGGRDGGSGRGRHCNGGGRFATLLSVCDDCTGGGELKVNAPRDTEVR